MGKWTDKVSPSNSPSYHLDLRGGTVLPNEKRSGRTGRSFKVKAEAVRGFGLMENVESRGTIAFGRKLGWEADFNGPATVSRDGELWLPGPCNRYQVAFGRDT